MCSFKTTNLLGQKLFKFAEIETLHRFLQYVDIPKKGKNIVINKCWNWIGGTTPNLNPDSNFPKYGGFWYDGTMVHAHRISYLFNTGSFPKNNCCRTCNNCLCVNPLHLFKTDRIGVINHTKHMYPHRTYK
jgi:hypothetical protein